MSNELLPKYLIADNSEFSKLIYVVHTQYPRFILNVLNDQIHWQEDFDSNDEKEIINNTKSWIKDALKFYDSEINKIQKC
ncbi:MAG: hypothetical protein CMC79_00230 [Flavobacteriaceae bacterium]|nr:hypothetical protein [Flavobacteriaceae bacterium]|tara:strand:- start:13286 stop:13525 length:240 start_codon:yes stop_codon:yes gene_type:complete